MTTESIKPSGEQDGIKLMKSAEMLLVFCVEPLIFSPQYLRTFWQVSTIKSTPNQLLAVPVYNVPMDVPTAVRKLKNVMVLRQVVFSQIWASTRNGHWSMCFMSVC